MVDINPTGLDWRRFIVMVDESNHLLACGQIKPHRDGTREVASLAVQPAYQGQGLGSAILTTLIGMSPLPLYLMCRAPLETYYQRFGFRSLTFRDLPSSYRLLWRVAAILKWLFPRRFPGLRVMVLTTIT